MFRLSEYRESLLSARSLKPIHEEIIASFSSIVELFMVTEDLSSLLRFVNVMD